MHIERRYDNMKKYLLPQNGNFYKANLHSHSTVSDGALAPAEMKKLYKENGYSIIAFTDHEVLVPHPELADDEFLPLNGYEMEFTSGEGTKTCHFCLIALDKSNTKQICFHRNKYFFANALHYKDKVSFDETEPDFEREHSPKCISFAMQKARDNGFFVTYNHPTWSLEQYEDYCAYSGMHAMEIFNTGSASLGFDEYNPRVYDDMLKSGKRIYCIAADDNHNRNSGRACDAFGGFTMIKAEKLEYKSVTNALLKGDFYSSRGPLIHDLYFEDGKVFIKCSPADKIVITGGGAKRKIEVRYAENGNILEDAAFNVSKEDIYFRITVTDEKGLTANTNAYFTDELFK